MAKKETVNPYLTEEEKAAHGLLDCKPLTKIHIPKNQLPKWAQESARVFGGETYVPRDILHKLKLG